MKLGIRLLWLVLAAVAMLGWAGCGGGCPTTSISSSGSGTGGSTGGTTTGGTVCGHAVGLSGVFGDNHLYVFAIDPNSGALTAVNNSPFATMAEPENLRIHPDLFT